MIFTETKLKGSYIIELEPVADSRGWFARTYCKDEFNLIGHTKEWLQINHSFTEKPGTVRGMHYQLPPFGEIKLVRCVAGAVYDVIVDLREGSATFMKHFSVELSSSNKKMIYIPAGFAHGFQALKKDTELIYHHSQIYIPGAEAGMRYNDPFLNIKWPMAVDHVSVRDNNHPLINNHFKGI